VLQASPSKRSSAVLAELLDNAIRNAISGLRSGDTNALLYVGEGGNPTPPSPTPPSPTPPSPTPPSPTPPSPTPPTGGCVQEKDCSVSAWCNSDLTQWCRDNAATCPAPFCRRAAAAQYAAQHEYLQGKFIAGVPVLNYHTAYEGESSLAASDGEQAGEWVVVVKGGTTDAQMQHLCKTAPNGCNLMGHPQGGVPFLEMRGTESDLEKLVQSAEGVIDFIEPDSAVHMIPEIESEVEAATWGLTRIGADSRVRTGAGTTIFVLDTGVRSSHNDFGGRAASALDLSSGRLRECNGDRNCATDGQGHGTHCAGTAGGTSFGVAPSAAVRSVKVLSDQGSGQFSWSYDALDWLAAGNGRNVRPAVASMSLGGPGTQQAMRSAVDAAVNSGVVVSVAGGNDNSDACGFSPAFVPSAITVGSTTSSDSRSSFSNYGRCTDIWAPGSSVRSASHTSDSGSTTLSGTSMACPHVSGGAALVLQASPSKSPSAVLAELLQNAIRGAISGLRSGDTNALLYVGEGGNPTPPSPTPPSPTPPSPTPPSPTPPTGGCVQEKDCSVSAWCNSDLMQWCRDNAAVCPAPYCRRA